MQTRIMENCGDVLIVLLFIAAILLGSSILCWLGKLFLASWCWLFGDDSEPKLSDYCGKCGKSWAQHRKFVSGENGGTVYPHKYWHCPITEPPPPPVGGSGKTDSACCCESPICGYCASHKRIKELIKEIETNRAAQRFPTIPEPPQPPSNIDQRDSDPYKQTR